MLTNVLRWRVLIALSAGVLAIGLAACGDDDSTEATDASTATAASAGTVDVTATEYEFDLSANPATDTTEINFINDGAEEHALVFAKLNEGYTVDEAYKLQGKKGSAVQYGTTGAKPGQTSTIEIKKPIEPGHYVLLCPISGPEGPHYKLGQLAEFDIG
jgi:hypothetical protein